MNRAVAGSFATLGVTALVGQVLLVRELAFVFSGNEFFIGWTLFGWLFWTALGAGVGDRGRARALPAVGGLAGCHLWAALALPVVLVLVRANRLLLRTLPGAVPDLLPAMAFSFVVLAPLCIGLGRQFAIGVRAWEQASAIPDIGHAAGRGYAFETAGFVLGGLFFSFLGVLLDPFRVAGLAGLLNVGAGYLVCVASRSRRAGLRLALVAALLALAPAALRGERLGRWTEAWRFPGQVLVESRQSIYGQLAVTALERQLNYYENGLLLGAENEPMASEQLAHYPLLAHPDPRRVLLIGGGFNGVLGEILAHAPDRVDYVELDPAWIALARKHGAAARRAALADPRVRISFADGRHFLKSAPDAPVGYDVVLVNLPNPATTLLNRYYTREFFRAVRRRLAPGGVLAVRLAFAPDYLGPELERLGASIFRTLRAEFASVALLPDYEILYLATAEPAPPPAADDWIARYAARGLRNDYAIPPAIRLRLETDRIAKTRAAFETHGAAQINRDDRPIACHYQLACWLRSFHPGAAAVANRLGEVAWPWGAVAVAGAALAMAAATRGRRAHRLGPWSMGVGSFSLMAGELVLLIAFQSRCGYLYYKLALILAALMAGMAAGTALGTRRRARTGPGTLAAIHVLYAVYGLALILFLRGSDPAGLGPATGGEWTFLLWAAALGGLAGYEFPAANRIYLAGVPAGRRRGGAVYAVDLAGSCGAALVAGLWTIPVLGTRTTLGLLVGLNLAAAALAARRSLAEPRAACDDDKEESQRAP
ncbi:MAG: hypothetical protein AB7V22_05925 [Kiritimatiellia bacterium]